MSGGFTDAVKQELAGQPLPPEPSSRDAELAWILRCAGALVRSGTPARTALVLETTSGAVARRVHGLLQQGHQRRPAMRVRAASGVRRRSTFALQVEDDAMTLGGTLGLCDARGLPLPARPEDDHPVDALRGALLGAGSVSDPGRAPHLEVACHDGGAAQALAATVRHLTDGRIGVVEDRDRPRVVAKSAATIGQLLVSLGAHAAAGAWEEQRERRRLRGEVTRVANADAANLRRSVAAAATQVAAVERVLAVHGWEGLDDDLRPVALARLTSPEASLSDLGELTDPPLSRSAVHRRLARIAELAEELGAAGGGGPDGG